MSSKSKQLGSFLRAKRERLSPGEVGLTQTKRRRTPGLRREEVAETAGISTDWYIRLEQGRGSLPSKSTAELLAKALLLDEEDRSHLFRLVFGYSKRKFKRESVPESVRSLIQNLPNPAYIMGARFDILLWNEAAAETLIDFSLIPTESRNLLFLMFAHPNAKRRFPNWEREARNILDSFRTKYDLWAHAPEFRELVEKVSARSPEFKVWWKSHVVRVNASGYIVIRHEKLGKVKLNYSMFQYSEQPELTLVLHSNRD